MAFGQIVPNVQECVMMMMMMIRHVILLCLHAAEELALSLSEALSSGDCDQAAQLCQKLSQLSVPVSVSISSQVYPQDNIR